LFFKKDDMLLAELIKLTPEDHPELPDLSTAHEAVKAVVAGINEHKRTKEEESEFARQLAGGEKKKQHLGGVGNLLGKGGAKKQGDLLDLTVTSVGKLKLKAVQARGLLSMDTNGMSDPYVRFELGDQHRKTKVKKKTLDPEWNQDFAFLVPSLDSALHVEVWDWDRVGGDDYIGAVTIPGLADVAGTQWFPLLTREDEPAGEIELALEYVQS
jgi:C2 domain